MKRDASATTSANSDLVAASMVVLSPPTQASTVPVAHRDIAEAIFGIEVFRINGRRQSLVHQLFDEVAAAGVRS